MKMKQVFFALCLLTAAQGLEAKWSNKKIAEYLEEVLHSKEERPFEDYLDVMEHKAGHSALVAFLVEFAEAYKPHKNSPLMLKALALKLVAKHKLPLALANKVRIVLDQFKGQDHVWQAKLECRRSNGAAVKVTHTEHDSDYTDPKGRVHHVHTEVDQIDEEVETGTTPYKKKVASTA